MGFSVPGRCGTKGPHHGPKDPLHGHNPALSIRRSMLPIMHGFVIRVALLFWKHEGHELLDPKSDLALLRARIVGVW